MVSDKPPRRSKSDKSPVTIDLSSDDVKAIATPVRSNDTDVTPGNDSKATPVSATDPVATSATRADTSKSAPRVPTAAATAEPAPGAQVSASAATGASAAGTAAAKSETGPVRNDMSGASPPHTVAPGVGTPAAPADSGPAPAKPAEIGANKPAAMPKADTASLSHDHGPAATGADSKSASGANAQPKTGSPLGTATADKNADAATTTSSAATAKTAPRRAPAAPALVAAGIFGGIVALLLAGSMQYAGYLPGTASAGRGSADIAALQQQVAALNERLAAGGSDLPARVAALESAGGGANTGLADRLAAIEAQVADARSGAAASGDLSQRLGALEAKINQPGREDAVAKALAASALKTAIDRGGPFTGELQTFAGVSADDPAAQNLQKFAQSGVPSVADLVQKFPQTADAILNAAHGTDAQAGIGSRLLSGAMQMVKVRPVGNVEGDTPEAVVARIEDRLRNSDLKGAAEQWNALPQASKDAGSAYKQTLDARIEVDGLVDNTLNRAIAGAGNAG